MIPAHRSIVADIMHYGRKMPLVSCMRVLSAPDLPKLRHNAAQRIAWPMILMKAFALVMRNRPELRQVYMTFPCPHLYESDTITCMVPVNRRVDGRFRLFFARFESPQQRPLHWLQRELVKHSYGPIANIRFFRNQIWFGRLPLPLRKALWQVVWRLSPANRVRYLGNCSFSQNVQGTTHGLGNFTPQTTSFGHGNLERDGSCRLTFTWDHRVLDALDAWLVLNELEDSLRGPICDELRAMAKPGPAPRERDGA